MSPAFFIADYFVWHYTGAFRDISATWLNFMWFLCHFFSLPIILRTFFSPWKRIVEEYHHTNIEDFAGTIIVNIMSRIFGVCIRLTVIVLCLVSLLLLTGLFVLFLFVWLFLPPISALLLLYGINLLFI